MALDRRQNFVYAQYLVNLFVDFNQILYMHDIDKMYIWMIEQYFSGMSNSYGPWLMLKFNLCAISCEPNDGLW